MSVVHSVNIYNRSLNSVSVSNVEAAVWVELRILKKEVERGTISQETGYVCKFIWFNYRNNL